uniref:DNA-directed DNA polymerase n=1 Tax=Utricularia reniformis TaxID=192314 RepID=A0A1Y0B1D0_9LAMI|nr:hypothetical protein AEK19_MT0996 [Utricularia reniformis]ART31220.1 hypothetical protein AEK19_MT0996 [Utricularia reniformis]
MHPFISREDCYYTDTDSVVLASQLPPSDVSKEEKVKEAAPKSYFLLADDGKALFNCRPQRCS